MTSLFLTDAEIDVICEGLGANSHATKCKRLVALGLIVNRKPNGRPLVVRSHAEAVLSGRAEAAAKEDLAAEKPWEPDREAYILKFRKRTA